MRLLRAGREAIPSSMSAKRRRLDSDRIIDQVNPSLIVINSHAAQRHAGPWTAGSKDVLLRFHESENEVCMQTKAAATPSRLPDYAVAAVVVIALVASAAMLWGVFGA